MNIRFEPTQLLDVKDLQYCEFCSQAVFSRSVHDDENCILNDLCLNDSPISHTKTLNFSFYQCFLKNCTLQVTNSDDFISHLKKHGIMLEGTSTKSKHKYKCQNCSYKTTQQRYLDSHNRVCTENNTAPDTSYIHDAFSGSSSSKSTTENDNSDCIQESSGPTPLQKFPSQDDERKEDDISSSMFTKKSHGYSCNNCSYSTTQRRYLDKHRTVCSGAKSGELKSKEVQIPCNRCSYVAQNSWALEVHMQSHTISQLASNLNKKGDAHDESDINQVNFGSADTVPPAEEDGDTEVHKCTDCSFKTKNLVLFNLHAKSCIRNKNRRDSVVKQKIAQVVLKRVISVKIKSEKLEEFKCEFCSFASKSKLRVTAHRASHFRKSKGEKYRKTGQLSSSLWKKTHTKNPQLSISSKSHVLNAPKLRCSFCPFKAKLSIMIKHHEKKCNSVLYRKFRCQTCSDVFSSQDMLNRHIPSCKIISINKKTPRLRRECKKCSFVTHSELVFAQHSSTCGIAEFERLRCPGCCHIFTQNFSLQRHLTKSKSCASRHMQVESNRPNLKCGKCPYQALNQASFVVHEALCGNGNFKRCPKCSFVAKSRYLFKKHVHGSCKKSSQIRTKLRECQKCSKMIRCSLYARHTQRCCNPMYDAYKCPHKDCSFVGLEENGLKVHIGRCHRIQEPPIDERNGSEVSFIRTNDGKFRCSFCPFTSAIKPRVETHIKLCQQMLNGNKTITKCDQSGCTFLSKSIKGLSIHKRRAHKQRPTTVNSVKSIDHDGENSSSVQDKVTSSSVNFKKHSAMRNYSTLYKCDKCPFSTAISKKQLLVHKALCFLKQSGTSEIIQCEYPNCYYLTEMIGSYKKHYKMKHSLSTRKKDPTKTNLSLKKPLALVSNAKITCSNCPYACRFRTTLKFHQNLCSRKSNGDPTVLACSFPGCYYLAKSQLAMNIHFGRSHHKTSTSFQEEITSPTVPEVAQLDTNLGDKFGKSSDNSSMMPAELTSCSPSKALPAIISFKHEPQTVDYYCCSRCSFRCLQSDTALIDSHKENCRTQLFEKFQLPAKDTKRIETTTLNKPTPHSPGTYVSEPKVSPLQLPSEPNNPVDTVEAVPLEGRFNKHSSSSSNVDDLAKHPDTPTELEALVPSSLENIAQKSNFTDGASSTEISSQSACEEMPVLDAHPSYDASLSQECDIFASDEEDNLSLCLDSEYFI